MSTSMKLSLSLSTLAIGLFDFESFFVSGQTCTDLGGSLASRFEPPTTGVVCLNTSTATCPAGVSYFGIDYDCSVASQGAERCFCTSDDRYIYIYI